MAVVISDEIITKYWKWTPQRMKQFAESNFSEDMVQSLTRQNQLRLANISSRELRSRTVLGASYIPFGLIPARFTRVGVTFQHYATNRNVSKSSFGSGRYDLFFHQLYESTWVRNASASKQFAVAVSLQVANTVPQNWSQLVKTDFGTSPASLRAGELLTMNSFNAPATFPFNMFVRPGDSNGTLLVTTPFRTRGTGSMLSFVSMLKVLTNTVLPDNRDSNEGVDYRIVNLFLVALSSQIGGGGADGLFALTAGRSDGGWLVNPKALLTPQRWDLPTCFWECVMAALCIRQESRPEDFTGEVDLWVKDMCVRSGLTARQREGQMKRIQWNVRAFIGWCEQRGIVASERSGVSVDDVERLGKMFGFESVCVLSESGDVMVGCKDDLHMRRAESNHLVLMYKDDHYSVVMSYTAMIPVKECTACGDRFASEKSLKAHLDKRSCLVCECVTTKMRGKFESESEWRAHRRDLDTLCLFRTTERKVVLSASEQRDRLAKRFPHDKTSEKRYGWYATKKANQQAKFMREMERDMSPIRNWKEALYVDLESVVPTNGLDVTRGQMQYQQAYACGWLRRSEALSNMEPTIVYGMDCLYKFFCMLDSWREDMLADEVRLWRKRCEEDLMVSAVPVTTKALENYACKLQKSWSKMRMDKVVCQVCSLSFEDDVHADGFLCECAKVYWSRNVAEKNLMQNFNDNAPRVTVWAHNGGRYDWLFVHRYLMERNLLKMCRVVRGGGKYYEIVYNGVFIFRDSLNFMLGSLERLGQDFKVETEKGVFPYRYLKQCCQIEDVLRGEEEVRAKLPASLFDISEKVSGPMGLVVKRPMTEEEYVEFMEARGWVYDVKAETCKYLADDVKCLSQVMECFRGGWQEMPFQPELFKYCTIGQMCHSYFLERYLDPATYPVLDVMEDTFIRGALYGGRTEVFQRCAGANDRIHYVDVNSLYPFVMESRFLPSGDPVWHFQQGDERIAPFRASSFQILVEVHSDLEDVMNRLNQCDASLYGFFEVDVECLPSMHYPVLPERVNNKNMFTNCKKVRMVYYSEELKFAVARGCRVTRVYAWCQWFRSKVYSKCIEVLKAEKMRGEGKDIHGNPIPGAVKNPSLRAAAKTAQNALYGKSIQFINETVQIVDNQEDLFKLVRTGDSDVTIQPIYRSEELDIVEVTVKPHRPKVQPRSCSAIGTAILAEARMVLYSYFEEVERVGGTILYCDTDSIVYAGDEPLPDSCLSESVYGKMKVEIDPDDILPGGFVALAPKCYSFLLRDGSPYVKCKGVNLASNVSVGGETEFDELMELLEAEEVLENLVDASEVETSVLGLSFEHLRLMVSGEKRKIVTKQMQFLKTRDRHIACIDTIKLLKDDFDKRWILEKGVTVPWSDLNRDICGAVERRDVGYVSNFLQDAGVLEIEYMEKKYERDEWFRSLFWSWISSGSLNAEFYQQSRCR